MNLHAIDITIIIGYLVFCLVIGLMKFGKIKNIRDYTLGTRPFSSTVLVATTFATMIGSKQIIGNIGKVYEMGVVFVIPLFFVPLCWIILAKIFVPSLPFFHKQKFMSLSDIMEYYYGILGRWVTNVISIIVTMGVTATSAIAIGYLLHYFLNTPEILGMFIGVSIVTIYSAFGGIMSVAFTDVFQFLIFFIALPVASISSFQEVGSLNAVISILPQSHLSIDKSNVVLFITLMFYALTPYVAIPYVQRALIAKDKKQFLHSFFTVGILFIPLVVVISFIGLIVYKYSPDINPNNVLYYFIDHYLGAGIKGLLIAGLLAVIMSTQDSFLNTVSSLISRDVLKKLFPKISDRQELIIARLSCVLVALLSMIVLVFKKGIMDIMWLVDNFWDPLITFPFLAALLGARISKRSFLILVFCSLSATSVVRLFTGVFDTRSLVAGVVTSIIVLYIGNRSYKKSHPELVQKKTKTKSLIIRLKNSVLTDDFSSHFLYGVSLVLGSGLVVSTFFLNLQQVTFLNVSFISAAGLFVLLLLGDLWSDKKREYILYIWKVVLTFTLLVLPSYILIISKAYFVGTINIILAYILFAHFTSKTKTIVLAIVTFCLSYIISRYQINTDSFVVTQAFLLSCTGVLAMTIIMMLYQSRYISREVIRQLDSKVQERTSELKNALAAKQEFLNKVSHEVRTPLHGIIGIAGGLDSNWDSLSAKEKRHYVKMISEGSVRLKNYTSNILDLSSIVHGKFTLQLKNDVNILDIARDAIKDVKYIIVSSNKNIKIQLETQEKLLLIACDPIRVMQIMSNLLNNAVQYSSNGQITLSIEQVKHEIMISVADNGSGVPDNEKKEVFKPFYESSRTKTSAKGRGLGLAIVRELVELHKGRIHVVDNKPYGSIFKVYLPKRH